MFPHKENILLIKVEKFTDRIIKLAAYLKSKHVDNYIINQISRAGTSIGANLNYTQENFFPKKNSTR